MRPKSADLLVLILIFVGCLPVQGARILAVLPLFARSHHRFSQPLLKALAGAGHEVVVYSPFPLDNPVPNYTDVFMDNVSTENEKIAQLVLQITEMSHHKCLDIVVDTLDIVFNDFIKSDKVQNLLASREHFDLVIVEAFSGQEFTLILGHIFKAPVIGLQAFMTNNVVNSISGNSLSLSHIPDVCSPFSNRMSFFERLRNSLSVLRNLYYVYYNKNIPLVEKLLRGYFPDAPPFSDMLNNVSLVFVNDHLTADYAQPRTPNIIPVAGIHIEAEKPLPKVIQRFMDEAPEGVILFSLGTYVPDELQPREYFDMYCRVFKQLKQRVLWKTRKENIQGLPDNVMTLKWVPQRDILAHSKCELFITHGGLLSQHEAVHCGVPVVAIPQFYDQHRTARFYQEQGIGVRLNIRDLSETTILAAVRTVLDNPQFTSNMKKLSRVFKDRPLTPSETVVYWTEYVLKHGGSRLRPASAQLSWYQLASLDVLAVILGGLASGAVVIYFILRNIFKYIYGKRETNTLIKEKCN